MQLYLTLEELELLTRILREGDRLSRSEVPSSPHIAVDNSSPEKLLIGRDLLRGTLSRNLQLGYDELEDLADSLSRHKKELAIQIRESRDAESKSDLERSAVVLEHLLEKVTEACAMV
ncbi:MAG TPA: hypothetical protein VEF05_11700 [Terriglobales bacterium]|nr:hypothetical protein [Terriglobales bacterium]